MSVQHALGIDELVDRASAEWGRWTATEPVLARFAGARDVERWRMDAPTKAVREVFLALGRLSQQDGTERGYAISVLAQLMLPGIEALVRRRAVFSWARGVSRRELETSVAGALWEQLACYPWHAPLEGSIPMGLQRGVARAVDREFGWGDRGEKAWRERCYLEDRFQDSQGDPALLDDRYAFGELVDESHRSQPLQASEVYWWAISEALVSQSEIELLVQLAVLASEDRLRAGSSGGLTSMTVCAAVGERTGQSGAQVRERAHRALEQLRAHAA